MTEPRPVQSALPSTGAGTHAPDRRHLQDDTIARFRQALHEPRAGLLSSMNAPDSERRNLDTSAPADAERSNLDASTVSVAERRDVNASPANAERHGQVASTGANAERRDPNASTAAGAGHHRLDTSVHTEPERGGHNFSPVADMQRRGLNASAAANAERLGLDASFATDAERRDPSSSAPVMPATVGSLHYSLPVTQATAEPAAAADTIETARLIEQATSVLLERASRSDACRFIVSLDHAIVGGASAEFVRDGAFLRVRLLARNDAAYRSMWTHQAELQERLATSTGLVTRIEILEVYGDGRSA